jgi:S1-C subfamily serine protease
MSTSTTLESLSTDLAGIVEKAAVAVVRVEGRRRAPSSGVVFAPDGAIVAAHHSVDSDEDVPVGLSDGRTLAARVVGRDPSRDLAVLRVDASGLVPPRWAATAAPHTGELVVSLSRPGRSLRARLGVVSAVTGEWRTPSGARLDHYLESDVALHPGFSGGLLLSARGEALGVNTAGILRGASFCVDARTVARVAEAVLAGRRPRRGWLGVATQPIALPEDLRTRLGQAAALLVLSVQAGGPAAKAGLLLGDVLLRAGEERLTSPAELLPALDEDRVGEELKLAILRAGKERVLAITVGEREPA